MKKVFVSYRRADSMHITGRLCVCLRMHFGPEQVFRNLDDITPTANFRETIQERLGQCKVLLAVIGGPNLVPVAQQSELARATTTGITGILV